MPAVVIAVDKRGCRSLHCLRNEKNSVTCPASWRSPVFGPGPTGLKLRHDEWRTLRQIGLPPEPIFHGGLQLCERNSGTNLDHAVGHRQGVVKDAGVGEVAHAEGV